LRFGRLDEGNYRIVINDGLKSENGIAAPQVTAIFTPANNVLIDDDFSNAALYPLGGNPNAVASPLIFSASYIPNTSQYFQVSERNGTRFLRMTAPQGNPAVLNLGNTLSFNLPMTFSNDAVLSTRIGAWTTLGMSLGSAFMHVGGSVNNGPFTSGFFGSEAVFVGGGFVAAPTDVNATGFADTLVNFVRNEELGRYQAITQTEQTFAVDRHRAGFIDNPAIPARHLGGRVWIASIYNTTANPSVANEISHVRMFAGIRPRVLHISEYSDGEISFVVNDDLNPADFIRNGNFQVKAVDGNRTIEHTVAYDVFNRAVTVTFGEILTIGEEYRIVMRDFPTATMMRMPESVTFRARRGFEVVEADFLNHDNILITSSAGVAGANNISPRLTIYSPTEATFRTFLAVFDGNVMLSATASEEIQISAETEITIGAGWNNADYGQTFKLDNLLNISGNRLRLFIFDENMAPLLRIPIEIY